MKKVKPGEPLVIPAATFNAFIDAANAYQAERFDAHFEFRPSGRDTGLVRVRNDSGADRQRFDVLGVSDVVVRPSDSLNQFCRWPILKGVVPTADHAERFVILQEPIAAGKVGRAVATGVTVVKVRINKEGDRTAGAKENQVDKLESGAGPVTLLYIQPPAERDVADVAWCVARIGGEFNIIEVGRIVLISESGREFVVRRISAAGTMFGPDLVVRAYSIRYGTGTVGGEHVRLCHPAYDLGDIIRFARQRVYTGTAWVDDYWTIDTFVPFGCVVSSY